MRKGITESGMPMLSHEFVFTVFYDQGAWWVESTREGVEFREPIACYDTADLGYEISLMLDRAGWEQ